MLVTCAGAAVSRLHDGTKLRKMAANAKGAQRIVGNMCVIIGPFDSLALKQVDTR